MNNKKLKRSERGATMLEAILAGAIGLGILVSGVYMLAARVHSVADVQVAKEGENRAEGALSALTASVGDLPDGGGFTAQTPDNELTLAPCTSQTCDYILNPDVDGRYKSSPARGYPYGNGIPTGYTLGFLRRWRIETVNADYNLRRISVAVLKDERDTKPSLFATTIAGDVKVQ